MSRNKKDENLFEAALRQTLRVSNEFFTKIEEQREKLLNHEYRRQKLAQFTGIGYALIIFGTPYATYREFNSMAKSNSQYNSQTLAQKIQTNSVPEIVLIQ